MDTQNITVAARVYLYLAPVGTSAPTAVGEPTSPWRNVGYTTPDGIQFATEPQFQDILSAQSDYPTGRIQTGDAAKLTISLQEFSGPNLIAAYGGGTITEVGSGTPKVYKFTPPKIGARQEMAAILRVVYGTKEYLWVAPRVFQAEGVPLDLAKTQETRLPLSLSILGGDTVDAWYLLSNDAAMAPAGGGS